MKALKCKPSAQFAYNYTIIMINVLSRCSNIISHRSSILEGRHIDRRSSKVDTSIFEGRHMDLRRLKTERSYRHSVNEYCPQRPSMVIPKIPRGTIDVCIGGGNGAANTASAVPNSYQGRVSCTNHLASERPRFNLVARNRYRSLSSNVYGSKLLSCSLTTIGVKDQRHRNFVTSHCAILHGKLSLQGMAARILIGARVIVVVVCVYMCVYVCVYVCMCDHS